MKKLISMALSLCMLLSICAANVAVAAGTPAKIGTERKIGYSGKWVDNTTYNMMYMDDDTTGAAYRGSDFLYGGDADNAAFVALKYPLSLRAAADREGYPAQYSSNFDPMTRILTSTRSGVMYRLPARRSPTGTNKQEVVVIDRQAVKQHSYGEMMGSTRIDIGEKVQNIHILIGTAHTHGVKQAIQAYVTYKDGTNSANVNHSASWIWNTAGFGALDDVRDTVDANGSNGYLSATIPNSTKDDQAAINFMGDFKSYVYLDPGSNYTKYTKVGETYTGTYVENKVANNAEEGLKVSDYTISAYEYHLTIDPTKEVDKLIIAGGDNSRKDGMSGKISALQRSGFAILGVTVDKYGPVSSSIDFSSNKNAKLFVANNTEEGYSDKNNFIGAGGNGDKLVAVDWPLLMNEYDFSWANMRMSKGIVYKTGNGTYIQSQLTDTSYKIERDEVTGKDAIILDGNREGMPTTAVVDIDDAAYDKISFLTANATYSQADYFKAYVEYTDGTKTISSALANDVDTLESLTDAQKQEAVLGSKGYIYGRMAHYNGSLNSQQIGSGNGYLMRLESFYRTVKTDGTLGGVGREDSYNPLVYEHTLTLDPTKMVDKIYFESEVRGTGIDGIAILSIAGTPVFMANKAAVADGECEVKTYTNVEGTIYAAIYEGDKLVATKVAAADEDLIQDVVIEDENISTAKNYDIKLFVWATDGSFKPLTTPLTDSYQAVVGE